MCARWRPQSTSFCPRRRRWPTRHGKTQPASARTWWRRTLPTRCVRRWRGVAADARHRRRGRRCTGEGCPLIRVALDARALEHPALADRGIGRYTRSLLDALAGEQAVVALRQLRRPPAPARVAELFEHALLARDVRRVGAEVLHSPSIDFATTRPGVPYVLTVHDLVPLKQPGRYLRTGLKHRLRYAAVKRATRVIVPTSSVAVDCARLLDIDRNRIDVIAEAPAPVFQPIADPRAALARFDLPDEFLLWVGGLD